MKWLRRTVEAIVAARSRGEKWEAGDLAICIAENWNDSGEGHPKLNEYLRVSAVCSGGLWLHFAGKPGCHYEANGFRKIQHDTAPAANEAWVEQLKHMRRKLDA